MDNHIYKFKLTVGIYGAFSTTHVIVELSSTGKTEQEAYAKLVENMSIQSVGLISTKEIR